MNLQVALICCVSSYAIFSYVNEFAPLFLLTHTEASTPQAASEAQRGEGEGNTAQEGCKVQIITSPPLSPRSLAGPQILM